VSDGRLSDAELKAIRRRLSRDASADYYPTPPDLADARALLAALDAVTGDRAAAEGALADLCSPQSGEANAAYLRGVEDERRRCVALLVAEADRKRERGVEGAAVCYDRAASIVATPPAPAAAPGGGS
jgi:hypothetical protein